MFKSVAAFELRYQLKSPAFWVTFAIFLLLTFAATASDNVQIGSGGNVWKNSPYAIAQTLMVMTVFAVFILTAFVANVVVRDDETGFGPIIHSTRLSRFDYLFGRFTGAFFAGCLLFLSAPLGMILGAAMPWLDPEERNRFLNLLAEIGENVVVILSTHIVEDVADLCPSMAIIASGRIVRVGAPLQLIASLNGRVWRKTIARDELGAHQRDHEVIATRLFGGRTVIHVLADANPGDGFEPMQGGLEDVYFSTLAGTRRQAA
jgi:hypothetical protein